MAKMFRPGEVVCEHKIYNINKPTNHYRGISHKFMHRQKHFQLSYNFILSVENVKWGHIFTQANFLKDWDMVNDKAILS